MLDRYKRDSLSLRLPLSYSLYSTHTPIHSHDVALTLYELTPSSLVTSSISSSTESPYQVIAIWNATSQLILGTFCGWGGGEGGEGGEGSEGQDLFGLDSSCVYWRYALTYTNQHPPLRKRHCYTLPAHTRTRMQPGRELVPPRPQPVLFFFPSVCVCVLCVGTRIYLSRRTARSCQVLWASTMDCPLPGITKSMRHVVPPATAACVPKW